MKISIVLLAVVGAFTFAGSDSSEAAGGKFHFSGTVRDEGGAPLLSTVTLGAGRPALATNPLTGKFEAEIAPGVYTVTAKAAGYDPKTNRVLVESGRHTVFNFTLALAKPKGTLAGSLKDAQGRPLSGSIEFTDSKRLPIAVSQNGKFSEEVSPGSIQIRAMSSGYAAATTRVPVFERGVATLDFILRREATVGTLSGKVVDAVSGKPVAGLISSEGMFPDTAVDGEGRFKLSLAPGTYKVSASSSGYATALQQVPLKAGKVVVVDFKLGPSRIELKKEKIEIKEKISFALGSGVIVDKSFPLLNEIADVLKQHPEVRLIAIEGYSDSQGAADYNLKLSETRAQAVRTYLVGRGIEGERLNAKGYGKENPIAPNDTEDGREKNRRVEFNIVE